MPCWPVGLGRCRCMVAVLLVFVVCLAVVLVLRVVLENVKFDLNDTPLCNLAGQVLGLNVFDCRIPHGSDDGMRQHGE